ncbi:sugar ABC transporter substrate-binding protein [Baekduia alba]|uniref:sugar ABC transporter substrate-binding protein n=1 Tax=Baekduia alba TaxID=2997333 RepID=UPI0023427D6B|nr:substrate-binding domain-containing protein [Baekduia alba]
MARNRPWLVAFAVCLAAAQVLSACGGSSTSASGSSPSGGSTSTTGSSDGAAASATLAKYYKGVFEKPPTSVPAPVRGKNVWMISCGQKFPVCTQVSDEFEAAAKLLGWKVTVFDSAGDPTKATAGIRQAVAAKADGIATVAFDCATIKGGLLAAKSAGIPTVNYVGVDCPDTPEFSASVNIMGSQKITDFTAKRGEAAADFTNGLLKQRGVHSGKVLMVQQVEQEHHKAYWNAYEAKLKSLCPSCDLVRVRFTNAQVPNPAVQIWKTAITANPDAKAVAFNSDAYITLGLGSALNAVKSRGMVVCCGSGEDVKWLRDGTVTAMEYWPYGYDTWSMADQLNQLLSGVKAADLPNEGGGFVVADATHNLPASADAIQVPFDYRKLRADAWAAAAAK